jgi:hypothetical protein
VSIYVFTVILYDFRAPSIILYDCRVILYDSKCFVPPSVGASSVPRHRQHMDSRMILYDFKAILCTTRGSIYSPKVASATAV